MKRILFVATLLLIVVSQNIFAESNENIEILKKGDLEYMVDFSDSLKQEIKSFVVWYMPKTNKELFKGAELIGSIAINGYDNIYIGEVAEHLAFEHFGGDKALNSEGKSNIYNLTYLIHIRSGRVYFVNLYCNGDAYNLITDKEILGFIEDFNQMKIEVNDNEEYAENIYTIQNLGAFNKKKIFDNNLKKER